MDIFFTYLKQNNQKQVINFLDKEIESLESLIDLHSNQITCEREC